MHTGPFIYKLVRDLHPDHVSIVCFNEWAWILSVDANSLLGQDAIRTNIAFGDCEIVRTDRSSEWAGLVGVRVAGCHASLWSLATTTVVFGQSFHVRSAVS
jgi:hypothetical protein